MGAIENSHVLHILPRPSEIFPLTVNVPDSESIKLLEYLRLLPPTGIQNLDRHLPLEYMF